MEPRTLPRRALLAVVLLAVLCLSVLAAWWLAQTRRRPIARASELLVGIRKNTLTSHWGTQPSTRWYILQDRQGQTTGYVVRRREPSASGYAGFTLRRLADVDEGEQWYLDATATDGMYAAGVYFLAETWRVRVDTQIILRKGRVTVVRPLLGRAGRADSEAPANYIAEGLLELVVAEVAKANAQARFCYVINSEAVDAGSLRFTPVTMSALGGGKVRVVIDRPQRRFEEVYHLDAAGEIFRIDDPISGDSVRLIDLHSLARDFPEVLDIQRKLESGQEMPREEPDVGTIDLPPV